MLGKSPAAITRLDRLFEESRSASCAVIRAEFVNIPAPVEIPASVTVALAPAGIVPSAQLIVPPELVQLPWLGSMATTLNFDGNTSCRSIPVASAGPKLVIEKV